MGKRIGVEWEGEGEGGRGLGKKLEWGLKDVKVV